MFTGCDGNTHTHVTFVSPYIPMPLLRLRKNGIARPLNLSSVNSFYIPQAIKNVILTLSEIHYVLEFHQLNVQF
jgi:hypothetical protein